MKKKIVIAAVSLMAIMFVGTIAGFLNYDEDAVKSLLTLFLKDTKKHVVGDDVGKSSPACATGGIDGEKPATGNASRSEGKFRPEFCIAPRHETLRLANAQHPARIDRLVTGKYFSQ